MDKQVKSHKNVARFVAFLGVLPGLWFLVATHTEIGQQLQIRCGYWIVALIIMTAVSVMYAILTKILMKDISIAHDNANTLAERRHYKMAYASTFIEALVASAIFVLSIFGFLVTDLQCYINKAM